MILVSAMRVPLYRYDKKKRDIFNKVFESVVLLPEYGVLLWISVLKIRGPF